MRVNLTWLQRWYRTLDEPLAHKTGIKQELFARLRDLFALQLELVFYDFISTSFEGPDPADLARYGHSRDGKPCHRQVLVGVVTVNGWRIGHGSIQGSSVKAVGG